MNPAQTSPFDPNVFKSMTFTESNSTESTPIPVGEWPFDISACDIKVWSKKDGSASGLKCVMKLETTDPAVVAVTGRPKNVVTHEMMLDLTPEGGLDMSKGMNVQLGRARDAVGLNKPGVAFSFDMFLGRSVKAAIKHEVYENRLQARVAGVAAVGAGSTAPSGYVPGQ